MEKIIVAVVLLGAAFLLVLWKWGPPTIKTKPGEDYYNDSGSWAGSPGEDERLLSNKSDNGEE